MISEKADNTADSLWRRSIELLRRFVVTHDYKVLLLCNLSKIRLWVTTPFHKYIAVMTCCGML